MNFQGYDATPVYKVNISRTYPQPVTSFDDAYTNAWICFLMCVTIITMIS